MLFAVDVATWSGRPVLCAHGELDTTTAATLTAAVADVLRSGRDPVIVDLSSVTFCDASGARALMASAWTAAQVGARVHYVCPPTNRSVQLIVRLLRLDEVLVLLPQLPGSAVPAAGTHR